MEEEKVFIKPFEKKFEMVLYMSRWVMAPIYLFLIVIMGMLTTSSFMKLLTYVPKMFILTPEELILVALSMIDMAFAASLVLIVIFSGYENFISRFDSIEDEEKPKWMGTVDFAGLKKKLIASIIAISSIHLLKQFMEMRVVDFSDPNTSTFMLWLVIVHVVFVVSGFLMAVGDYFSKK